MGKALLAEALQLSVAERIQLVEDIWDSIAELPYSINLTDAQREELDRRLEDHQKNPHDGISWDTLKSYILGSK